MPIIQPELKKNIEIKKKKYVDKNLYMKYMPYVNNEHIANVYKIYAPNIKNENLYKIYNQKKYSLENNIYQKKIIDNKIVIPKRKLSPIKKMVKI